MINVKDEIVFLSGQGNYQFCNKTLKELNEFFGNQKCELSYINFNKHGEGEFDNRIENYLNIKGKTVVFYQSMYSQELYDEAQDLIWACKYQYGAERIIGVFPFFWNRRQDPSMNEGELDISSKKKIKPDEIQRLKETMFFLSVAGLDEMMVVTPHSSKMRQYCEENHMTFHEIDVSEIFVKQVRTLIPTKEHDLIKVYAPDEGSIPRAVNFAKLFPCPVLFNLKDRADNLVTHIRNVPEDEVKNLEQEYRERYHFNEINYVSKELVKDKIIVIIEDEVTTCQTANKTGQLVKGIGAKSVSLLVTHPVLVNEWMKNLFINNPWNKIIMTDTIPRGYAKSSHGRIVDASVTSLVSEKLFHVLNDPKND